MKTAICKKYFKGFEIEKCSCDDVVNDLVEENS